MSHVNGSRPYSRAEYLSDAAIHVLGISAALVAGPILVALAAHRVGDAPTVTAITVYTITLVAMLVCSALFNMVRRPEWVDRLRRLDQSVIYLKIAGTYTPFVALLSGSAGFLAGIWGVAAAGVSIIVLSARQPTIIALVLYLGLGWAGAWLGGPLLANLHGWGLALLVTGGLLYTIGVAFNQWSRLPFHNTIWHVFVLVASMACYAAICVELLHHTTPT